MQQTPHKLSFTDLVKTRNQVMEEISLLSEQISDAEVLIEGHKREVTELRIQLVELRKKKKNGIQEIESLNSQIKEINARAERIEKARKARKNSLFERQFIEKSKEILTPEMFEVIKNSTLEAINDELDELNDQNNQD